MIKNYSCIPLIVCIFVKVTRCALDQPYDYTQCNWSNPEVCRKEPPRESLQWRHNERDGVSNRQPHDCLLNLSFRRRSKKTSRLRVTGLCERNSEGPVTRKMFLFDDVIMMIEHDWRQKTEKKSAYLMGHTVPHLTLPTLSRRTIGDTAHWPIFSSPTFQNTAGNLCVWVFIRKGKMSDMPIVLLSQVYKF